MIEPFKTLFGFSIGVIIVLVIAWAVNKWDG